MGKRTKIQKVWNSDYELANESMRHFSRSLLRGIHLREMIELPAILWVFKQLSCLANSNLWRDSLQENSLVFRSSQIETKNPSFGFLENCQICQCLQTQKFRLWTSESELLTSSENRSLRYFDSNLVIYCWTNEDTKELNATRKFIGIQFMAKISEARWRLCDGLRIPKDGQRKATAFHAAELPLPWKSVRNLFITFTLNLCELSSKRRVYRGASWRARPIARSAYRSTASLKVNRSVRLWCVRLQCHSKFNLLVLTELRLPKFSNYVSSTNCAKKEQWTAGG